MAKKTKLKISELNSVDMCRRGANQESDIALFKNEEGAPGDATPADAPEGAGTVEVPNTLWKSIVDFARGLMAKTEPNTDESYEEEEEDEEEADVEKSAETFNQRRAQQEIRDDRWKYKDALDMSVESILNDDDLSEEEKVEMIGESIDQFATAYKEMCEKLLKIRVTANKTVVTAKSAEPDEDPQDEGPDHEEEGEEEMKIDKSRFSPEELEQYTALIAKGRVDEDNEEWQEEEEVETKKSMEMHPEVAKALEEMKSIQKSMEMKEMTDIAKKYTLLGKKEEELAETLYTMKKSSPEAYNEYIAVLDQSMQLVEKNGMFEEIGKSSRGMAGGTTEDKITGIAKSYMEKDPELDYHTAVMKAWENNPELMAAYDEEY